MEINFLSNFAAKTTRIVRARMGMDHLGRIIKQIPSARWPGTHTSKIFLKSNSYFFFEIFFQNRSVIFFESHRSECPLRGHSNSWDFFFSVLSNFLLLSSCFACWLISSKRRVTSVVYSPCGTKIASGSRDKTVRIWNAQTGQCVSTLSGHTSG